MSCSGTARKGVFGVDRSGEVTVDAARLKFEAAGDALALGRASSVAIDVDFGAADCAGASDDLSRKPWQKGPACVAVTGTVC